jgi:hypothetical protein
MPGAVVSLAWRCFSFTTSDTVRLVVRGEKRFVKLIRFYVDATLASGRLARIFVGRCFPNAKVLEQQSLRPVPNDARVHAHVIGQDALQSLQEHLPLALCDIVYEYCVFFLLKNPRLS